MVVPCSLGYLAGSHCIQVADTSESGPLVVEAVVGSTVPSALVPFSAEPIMLLWLPSLGLGLNVKKCFTLTHLNTITSFITQNIILTKLPHMVRKHYLG